MDEQIYPLVKDFDLGGRDMSVPLRVNICGYFHGRKSGNAHARVRQVWTLRIIKYREFPGNDPEMEEAGQFTFYRPDVCCRVQFPKQPEVIGYYWLYFTGNMAEKLLQKFHLEPEKPYTLQEGCLEEVYREFDQMLAEAAQKRQGYPEMLCSLLIGLIVRLARGSGQEETEKETQVKKRLVSTLLFIQSNYADAKLNVPRLADQFHLSKSHFRKIFRESQGVTPTEYITQLRIAHACELLQNTNHTIAQIAEYCGYPDFSYFTRVFRKRLGMTPSEYRNSPRG